MTIRDCNLGNYAYGKVLNGFRLGSFQSLGSFMLEFVIQRDLYGQFKIDLNLENRKTNFAFWQIQGNVIILHSLPAVHKSLQITR